MQTPSPDMPKADIVAAIKKAGFTQERLSEKHGLAKSAVSVALCKPWPAVERFIARAIRKKAHEIWPSRYDRTGVPIKRGDGVKSKRPKSGETFLNNRSGRAARNKFDGRHA